MDSATEQTRYGMWTRRKLRPTISMGSSYNESWEEQAFAEDSAGLLGGCVWPPRSYSCSYCRREFRSAQALGGHMNVHRRDRARLKQSCSPTSENGDTHHHQNLCNPNPSNGGLASPPSPSRLLAASTQENCSEHTLVSPSYSSSIFQDHLNETLFSTPRFLADPVPIRPLTNLELRLGRENWRLWEVGSRRRRDHGVDDDAEANSCKRLRSDPVRDRQLLQSELLKFGHGPVEELDLELRLGDPPKV